MCLSPISTSKNRTSSHSPNRRNQWNEPSPKSGSNHFSWNESKTNQSSRPIRASKSHDENYDSSKQYSPTQNIKPHVSFIQYWTRYNIILRVFRLKENLKVDLIFLQITNLEIEN